MRRSAYPPDIVPASSCLLPTGATAHSHRDSLFSSNEIFSLSLFLKSVRLSQGKKKKKKKRRRRREKREKRERDGGRSGGGALSVREPRQGIVAFQFSPLSPFGLFTFD